MVNRLHSILEVNMPSERLVQDIQAMFEDFGLGTEEQRQRFRDLACRDDRSNRDSSGGGFILHLGNSTTQESSSGEDQDAKAKRILK
jgi:hypothetical protein